MKVLIIAGTKDPLITNAADCAARCFEDRGIGAEIAVLNEHVQGCTGCGRCWKTGICVFDDEVNRTLGMLDDVRGLMVLTPVYYGEPAVQTMNFLDRLFWCGSDRLALKPAVSVCSGRGSAAAKAQARLNERFAYADMMIVSHKNGFVLKEENDILIPAQRLACLIRNMDEGSCSFENTYTRELDYVR
jgi:multimeric flavodoxin WrbA